MARIGYKKMWIEELRNMFENNILDENVVELFMNASNDMLRKLFGEEFLKVVNYEDQKNSHHQYELFEHILRTVESAKIDDVSETEGLYIKVAAFFHDIGKPMVAKLSEKTGQMQYINHANKSAELAAEILKDLGYEDDEIERITFLIRSHDDFIQFKNVDEITIDKLSKVLSSSMKKSGNYKPTISDFKKLLILCRADASAQSEIIKNNGEVVDSRKAKLERYDKIEEVLPDALVYKQNLEILKLEKQINELLNGPAPIEKNGRIVNQRQIDIWKSLSDKEKTSKVEEIKSQIMALISENNRLLELQDGSLTNGKKSR